MNDENTNNQAASNAENQPASEPAAENGTKTGETVDKVKEAASTAYEKAKEGVQKASWGRLAAGVLYLFALNIVISLIVFLAAVQLIVQIVAEPIAALSRFQRELMQWVTDVHDYVLGRREKAPFPADDWQQVKD